MAFTEAQQIALANIPRIPAFISIVGSSSIVYTILSDWKRRIFSTYHRILLITSLVDILQSGAISLTTLPMPKDTSGAWGARGNTQTCEAQGFFIQLGVAMPLYTVCLTLYYLLTVRYNIDDSVIKRKIEPLMHLVALGYPTMWAFAALPMDLYNPLANMCHIYPYPAGCDLIDGMECTRGKNAKTIVWFSGSAIMALSVIIVPLNLTILYLTIRQQEQKMLAYGESAIFSAEQSNTFTMGDNSEGRRSSRMQSESKRARAVLSQAMLYVGAFLLVFIWETTIRITVFFVPVFDIIPLLFTMNIFYPMQGFFYFFIYIRTTALKVRRRKPSWSFLKSLLFATIYPKEASRLINRGRRITELVRQLSPSDNRGSSKESLEEKVETKEEPKMDENIEISEA